MDSTLKRLILDRAKAQGVSQNEFMVRALTAAVTDSKAAETDAIVAPFMKDLVSGLLRTHMGSQRKLLVRLAYEVLRQQYVLCEFMVRAGVTAGEIEGLRHNGWAWAVKVFRDQPDLAIGEGNE